MYRTGIAVFLLILMGMTPALPARAESKLLNDSRPFTVVDAANTDAAQIPSDLDRVVIGLMDGRAIFLPKGEPTRISEPRAVVVELKDVAVPPLPNTSGYPDAFPRPGAKKLIENKRVTVWDYTWAPGVATPMDFHAKQVVVTYFGNGTLRSTTVDGQVSDTKLHDALVTFNPPNRTHTETLVDGTARAVIVELN